MMEVLGQKKFGMPILVLTFRWLLLVIFGSALLSGCARPKDIAIVSRSQVGGVVHTGVLRKVVPIYLDRGFSQSSRYGFPAGAGAATMAEYFFERSRNRAGLVDFSRELGRASVGALEERNNSLFCQYFIETIDASLFAKLKADLQSGSLNDQLRTDVLFRFENEVIRLRSEIDQLFLELRTEVFGVKESQRVLTEVEESIEYESPSSRSSIGQTQLERLENSLADARLQIEAMRSVNGDTESRLEKSITQLDKLLMTYEQLLENELKDSDDGVLDDPKLVSIVNPCRSFEIGSTLTISSLGSPGEYILQHALD